MANSTIRRKIAGKLISTAADALESRYSVYNTSKTPRSVTKLGQRCSTKVRRHSALSEMNLKRATAKPTTVNQKCSRSILSIPSDISCECALGLFPWCAGMSLLTCSMEVDIAD